MLGLWNAFLKHMVAVSDWLWGDPLLYLLGFGALFITFSTGFVQFRHARYIFQQTLGQLFKKKKQEDALEGTITPFQALTTALANTVGAGNIVGVPLAIMWGGPGAVFWMWLLAFFGMATKFAEVVLGQKYRTQNAQGDYVGGPQYFLTAGLKKYHLGWLGGFYALALMMEAVPDCMVQCNSLVHSLKEAFGFNITLSGIVITLICGVVLFGGVKLIGSVTEKMVPLMALLFVGSSLVIIALNIGALPGIFSLIVTNAFKPMAAAGGFAGATVASALRWGMARGAYSNEAGDGTAAVAHSAAITDHPVRQGLYAVTEVFLDTIVVCTATALVVLISQTWMGPEAADKAEALTTIAFGHFWGPLGKSMVAISLSLFALSSIMAYAWYGEKQAEFLGGTKFALFMRCVFIGSIMTGIWWDAKYLWPFMDIFFALMIIPTVIGLLLMHKEVRVLCAEYFNTPGQYYLKDIETSQKEKHKLAEKKYVNK